MLRVVESPTIEFGTPVTRGRNRTNEGVLATMKLLLDAGADINARMVTDSARPAESFVFSTHNPILEDLSAYPRVSAYVSANYVEMPRSERHLMIDRRRVPTGQFGRLGCSLLREIEL